jgi:hypothetical protein
MKQMLNSLLTPESLLAGTANILQGYTDLTPKECVTHRRILGLDIISLPENRSDNLVLVTQLDNHLTGAVLTPSGLLLEFSANLDWSRYTVTAQHQLQRRS